MGDKNVLSLSFDTGSSTNSGAESLFVQKLAPRNVNLTPATGAISGDVIWEISTPKDTFLDLSKTYMSAEVLDEEKKDDSVYLNDRLLLPCMFQRAVVYLNGVRITTSNNYTQDGFLSRRLMFGESYNKSVNSMFDIPAIAAAYLVAADAANKHVIKDTLDSLWLRQSEGLIVPPNCNIRFEFTVDSNWRAKNVFTGSANPVVAVGVGAKIQNLWMHPCFYVNPQAVAADYRLRFISVNSFKSTLASNGTSLTLQYTIGPSIKKCCFTMQAANYETIGVSKRTAAFQFDNLAKVQTLQFKHGNVVYPQTIYNFGYGLEQAYEDYVNHSQQIAKDSGKESYDIYANQYQVGGFKVDATNLNNWGPIIVAPIVKNEEDATNTIEINATFTGVAATTYTYLSSLEEQVVNINMGETGMNIVPTF